MSHLCAAVGSTCGQLLASYWSKTTAIRLRWTGGWASRPWIILGDMCRWALTQSCERIWKDLDGPCSRHLIAILVLWMDTVIHQWNQFTNKQIPKQMPCVPTWLQDLRVLNQPWAMDQFAFFFCTNILQLQWLGLMDNLPTKTIIYTISPLARDFCDEKWDHLTMATGIVMLTGWLGTDESKSGDSQTMIYP